MGYTQHEIDLISSFLKPGMSVIDMGAQCDYTTGEKDPPFVSKWYQKVGITDYTCVDLAGDNNALRIDLSKEREWPRQYDLVIDVGTGEHLVQAEEYKSVPFHDGYINSVYPKGITDKLRGFYSFWVNKHNLCKIGGRIISVNPETGQWPDHGYHYLTKHFYTELIEWADYGINYLGRDACTGNVVTGWNVVCVMEKKGIGFPNFDMFKELPIFDK